MYVGYCANSCSSVTVTTATSDATTAPGAGRRREADERRQVDTCPVVLVIVAAHRIFRRRSWPHRSVVGSPSDTPCSFRLPHTTVNEHKKLVWRLARAASSVISFIDEPRNANSRLRAHLRQASASCCANLRTTPLAAERTHRHPRKGGAHTPPPSPPARGNHRRECSGYVRLLYTTLSAS